jgi:cytochrome c oxidase subunit III
MTRFDRSSTPRIRRSLSTGQFGMNLALVSIASLFVATVIAYLVTRDALQAWQRVEANLPWGLYVNTLPLVGASAAFESALRAIRKNRETALRQRLWLGGMFAVAFLVGQVFNWFDIIAINPDINARLLSLFTFYLLTGVHAVHVMGGFVPLAWVLHRAQSREYSSSRHEGVQFCVQYWHFLGVMWLFLLTVMALV